MLFLFTPTIASLRLSNHMFDRPPKYIAYGTAGFRDNAADLDTIVYRVGLVAAMRSRYLGKTVGVMITASHNPPEDNGAKIIDPLGDMLQESWESRVAEICNAQTDSECVDLLKKSYLELNIPDGQVSNVVYGRDTRASGPRLAEALQAGLLRAESSSTDFGLVTTPQLHYITRCINDPTFGEPTVDGYFKKISSAFSKLTPRSPLTRSSVTVDCANGVGAVKLLEMMPYINDLAELNLVNVQYTDPDSLNVECGADYVKTNQHLPKNVQPEHDKLCCSLDGDADRIVFYLVHDGNFCLLDGDKIASLAAGFFRRFQEDSEHTGELEKPIDIGVVQTAYANGSSTNYIKSDLHLPVDCTKTGVKHLHHVAQKYGIGIYFEANGHGTVLFNQDRISDNHVHSDVLNLYAELVNQTVGDAISDLFLVLAILETLNITAYDWFMQYVDLPNKLMKTRVKDRNMFKTTDAERRLVNPEDVQQKIDELVRNTPQGRCFVRASGTEDVVRVYAEAQTQESCDALAKEVCNYIAANY